MCSELQKDIAAAECGSIIRTVKCTPFPKEHQLSSCGCYVLLTHGCYVLSKSKTSKTFLKERHIMETRPTHEQAQLHLQVYDLRREERLRKARDWFQQNFRADSMEEAMRLAAPGTEAGTNFGMVIGYWEQTCALLNYGLLHEELFFETTGEFFLVWETLKPVAAQFREAFKDKTMLSNLERAAKRYEQWKEERAPGHIATMRQYMQQERAKAKGASS